MQILDRLFGPKVDNFERSLNRLSLRQSVLTGNLANVDTPGYKRRDVDFAIELKQAESGLPGLPTDQLGGVKVDPGAISVSDNGVDMEAEVFDLGENEIRYQTMSQMTRGYFRGLKNVIREGR
ncbi:MAG TPA: flagellar basal body protein [Fimbriimonadaceae bacterium]|nr:flagellar basal body protein [Fimbriimonadaceae bacterium]